MQEAMRQGIVRELGGWLTRTVQDVVGQGGRSVVRGVSRPAMQLPEEMGVTHAVIATSMGIGVQWIGDQVHRAGSGSRPGLGDMGGCLG